MRLTAAFVAHELRIQGRSLRFRVLAVAYAVAATAPLGLAVYLLGGDSGGIGSIGGSGGIGGIEGIGRISGGTAMGEMLPALPLLTATLAALLALDAVTRESQEGAWSTVSLAGLSSAGYLLRRWVAVAAVLLPLTLVPHLAAAAVALAGGGIGGIGGIAPAPIFYPWLLVTLPVALTFSALALAAGTVAGGAGGALLFGGFLLYAVPQLAAAACFRFGLRFDFGAGWLAQRQLDRQMVRIRLALDPKSPWREVFPQRLSDAPYDLAVAAEPCLAAAVVPLAFAGLALGVAVFYLRRCRPDLKPWRIAPGHPLRTFLAALSRLREHARPDPRPGAAEILTLGAALLLAAAALAWQIDRARSYQRLAGARYAAEEDGGPAPMPVDLLAESVRLTGRIGPGRSVEVTAEAVVRNAGRRPQSHLAFELDPYLRVLAVDSAEGPLRVDRRWDRLAADLAAPLPPGGRRTLRFHLAGEPGEVTFPLAYGAERGFHRTFGALLHARFARDLADFSRSSWQPALSARRIELAATDLLPVPRYESWRLDEDGNVPPLVLRPPAELALSLAIPPGLLLADSCGGIAQGGSGPSGRLAGHCRLALADLRVAGGALRPLTGPPDGITLAVLPGHAALARRHLGFLDHATRQLGAAWPELGDLHQLVILEDPEDSQAFLRGYDQLLGARVETRGNLVRLSEDDLARSRTLAPDALVAALVADRLSRRRPIAVPDAAFFSHLFRALAHERLGDGPRGRATVGPLLPGQGGVVRIAPPATQGGGHWLYWTARFPALVAALEARMGGENLRRAIEELLSREDGPPATAEELYALLGTRSEAPLGAMIQDFFRDGALPQPVLSGVAFRRAADGWQVSGRVSNEGDGTALCRVVLATDLGTQETTVQAKGGEAAQFSFTTLHRPQTVRLDPERECHRLIPNGAPRDQVFFDGKER